MSPIHRRAATEKELKALTEKLDGGMAMYGCITIIALAIPAVALYVVGDGIGAMLGKNAAMVGRWVGPLLAVMIYLNVVGRYANNDRKRRAAIQKDLDHQEIEEILIQDAHVGLIGAPTSGTSNALVFALADRKLLYLKLTSELFDRKTYGAAENGTASSRDIVNGLASPYSFPSSQCIVRRFPQSGSILGIEVQGEYVPPRQLRPSIRIADSFRPSEIFTGSLENISDVLEIEHAQRKRGDTL